MKNKTKYNLFITLLVFIGLIVAVGLFLSVALLFTVFFTQGIRDLMFFPQFLILGMVFFSVFPIIMILISNVYFKISGNKTWGNWLKIALRYEGVFTVITIYQSAFAAIEFLIFAFNFNSSGVFDRIIMLPVPFLMLYFSEKILKKLFGYAADSEASETTDDNSEKKEEDKLRKPRILCRALLVFVIAAGLAGFILPQYSYITAIIMYITPFALFLIIFFSKGLIRFDFTSLYSQDHCSVVLVFTAALIFIISFNAVGLHQIISGQLIPSVVLAILILIAAFVSGGKAIFKKWTIITLVIFAAWYGYFASKNINLLGKHEIVETFPVTITKRWNKSNYRGPPSYFLRVTPNQLEQENFPVDFDFYLSVEEGQELTIDIYKGLLGIKYFVMRDRQQ